MQFSNRGGYRGNKIVFTQSGYALLIKPMKDLLAWDIYKHVLSVYFAAKAQMQATIADGMIGISTARTRLHDLCINNLETTNNSALTFHLRRRASMQMPWQLTSICR